MIIHVDLVLCTGYNLCASRQASLRGLVFTKKSVLKMRIRYFLNFNKKGQQIVITSSEDPSLTTCFFLGVMAWGEGDIQMSDVVVIVDGPPPQDPKIMKIEMFTKTSKRGSHNLILSASCTKLKGEQFWFSSKSCLVLSLTIFL